MTELSFLIKLLLNEKLQKSTRDMIAARIEEVQLNVVPMQHMQVVTTQGLHTQIGPAQCASTQAILERNPDLVAQPVAQVAQTQATAAAMASRNQAIAESMAGKVDKTTGRPRKF